MKIAQINPKNINLNLKRFLRSKKSRSSLSREDPSSLGSVALSSSSSSSNASTSNEKLRSGRGVADLGTRKSVLPGVSGDWSDSSVDIPFEPVPNISKWGWPKGGGEMAKDFLLLLLLFFFLKKYIFFNFLNFFIKKLIR
jgi:hypothetical protein